MKRSHAPYEVGYGKPPRHAQFKPGRSGNPKGRPKGSLNLATLLERALHERVVILEKGRHKTVTKFEATIKGLVNRAVKGEPRALQQLLGLFPLLDVEEAALTDLEAGDAAIIASLRQRFSAGKTEV